MAVNQFLQPSDVYQRRLDILGRAQNIDMSSASQNKVFSIFNTGDVGYPAPSKRVYVAYLVVEFSAGSPPQNTFVNVGVNGGLDWMGAGFDLWSGAMALNPPYVLSPTVLAINLYNPPVYGPGLAFTVKNVSINPIVATTGTFTAVGWAE